MMILLAVLAQVTDTTGFSSDQRFVYLLVGQIVTLVGLGIPVVLALLKMWENSRKVDANTALTAATATELAVVHEKVDGSNAELRELTERAAKAEGKLEARSEAPPVPPVIVVPPVAQPTRDPSQRTRATDAVPPTSAPPDVDQRSQL